MLGEAATTDFVWVPKFTDNPEYSAAVLTDAHEGGDRGKNYVKTIQ